MPLFVSVSEKIIAGRYRILKKLNSGGFSVTYLAEDIQLPNNRHCVVKQFKLQSEDELTITTAKRLFAREASTLNKLGEHSQIPRLLAHLEEDQEFYLVQEYIEGHNLDEEIKPGTKLQESQVVKILDEILAVLTFVHQHKAIHWNIKPSNIVRRNKDGKLLILFDFGAMKEMATQISNRQTIRVVVTPEGYTPIEQKIGVPRTASDVYALGMMAIFALTGIYPDQLSRDSNTGEIQWRDRIKVNPKLADIIDRMIRYDFRHRYPSAIEAHQAIQEFLNHSLPPVAKFPVVKRLLAGFVTLFILSGASYYFWQHNLMVPKNQTEGSDR